MLIDGERSLMVGRCAVNAFTRVQFPRSPQFKVEKIKENKITNIVKDALKSRGYSQEEAEKLIKQIGKENKGIKSVKSKKFVKSKRYENFSSPVKKVKLEKLYKIVNVDFSSENLIWKNDVTYNLPFKENVGVRSHNIFLAFKNINLALLMNPRYEDIKSIKILEAEGEIVKEDYLGVGVFKLKIFKEIPLPNWYMDLEIRKGVQLFFAALHAHHVLFVFEARKINVKLKWEKIIKISKDYTKIIRTENSLNTYIEQADWAADWAKTIAFNYSFYKECDYAATSVRACAAAASYAARHILTPDTTYLYDTAYSSASAAMWATMTIIQVNESKDLLNFINHMFSREKDTTKITDDIEIDCASLANEAVSFVNK